MTVPLLEDMPLNTWPWMTQVDFDSDSSKYGYDLCGPLKYEVFLCDLSVSPPGKLPTDLVKIVTDTGDWTDAYLVYEPLLIDQPGSY